MKPFKPRSYRRRRIITYKRLFLATLFILMSYTWYQACDEVSVNTNNKETAEVN